MATGTKGLLATLVSVATFMQLCMSVVGRDLYVSKSGNDSSSCTSPKSPCQTLQHTISLSHQNDVIHLDTSAGPYDLSSRHGYINITHSLTVVSAAQTTPAILDCGGGTGHYKLFNVSSHEKKASTDPVTLNLIRLTIKNCKPTEGSISDGVILLNNADVRISQCKFTSNGPVLKSPENLPGLDICREVSVYISDSVFILNMISKPSQAAAILWGCDSVKLTMDNVTMEKSPTTLHGVTSLKVTITSVTFLGGGVKGANLDITLANSTNQIALTSCTIADHTSAHSSPVNMAANKQPAEAPSLHLNSVTFVNNSNQHTNGGALSIFARFFQNTPIRMDIKMTDCHFIGNSATYKGGAVYLYNIAGMHFNQCRFIKNKARQGGAIFAEKIIQASLTNSIFSENVAKPQSNNQEITYGGALYLTDGTTMINNCSFLNNTATYKGAAIFSKNISDLSIQLSNFVALEEIPRLPLEHCTTSLLSLSFYSGDQEILAQPHIKISHTKFKVSSSEGCTGALELDALLDWSQSSFQCDVGSQLKMAVTKGIHYYRHLVSWCANCPNSTYSLHGGQTNSTTSTFTINNYPCTKCPDNGICFGGKVQPKPNYWGKIYNDSKVLFYRCPLGYCCQEGEQCPIIDTCYKNRRGVLCGGCREDHRPVLAHAGCISQMHCSWNGWSPILFVICSVLYACLLLYRHSLCVCVVHTFHKIKNKLDFCFDKCQGLMRKTDNDAIYSDLIVANEDEAPQQIQGVLPRRSNLLTIQEESAPNPNTLLYGCSENRIKVVVYFQQMAPLIYRLPFSASGKLRLADRLVAELFYLRPLFSALGDLCGYHQLDSHVWWVFSGYVALPLAILLVQAMVFFVMMIGCCGHSLSDRPGWSATLVGGIVSGALYAYAPMLHVCASLVHCTDIGNKSVLFVNGETSCYQPWQYVLLVYIATCLIPLPIALWFGANLLRHSLISVYQFITAVFFPIPFILSWPIRFRATCFRSSKPEHDDESLSCSAQHILAVVHGSDQHGNTDGNNHIEVRITIQKLLTVMTAVFLSSSPVISNTYIFTLEICILLCCVFSQMKSNRTSILLEIFLAVLLTLLAGFAMYIESGQQVNTVPFDMFYLIAVYFAPATICFMLLLSGLSHFCFCLSNRNQ